MLPAFVIFDQSILTDVAYPVRVDLREQVHAQPPWIGEVSGRRAPVTVPKRSERVMLTR